MAYELVQNGKTQFAIDWEIVSRLTRSYYTAYLQIRYGHEVTLSDSRWYNPLSWSLPDISHIEVNWDAVRRDALSSTERDVRFMRLAAQRDAPSVGRFLESRIDEAAAYKEQFVDWMGNIQTRNMRNVEKSVGSYEADKEIATFVRDRSYDMLMVGASVMTGGEALAVMGAGSFLKGQAKFQDSGRIGAAVMEGAGSFVFAYVKLGKKFTLKQDVVLALVQAPYKMGTELVSGDSFADAARSGSLVLLGPFTDRLFKVGPGKTLFDKVALPIVIKDAGKKLAKHEVTEMLTSSASGLVQGAIEHKVSTLGRPEPRREAVPDADSGRPSVINDATLTNKYLLYFAFVSMDKGIGRGW